MKPLLSIAMAIATTLTGFALDDPGKTEIGVVHVTVYFATDGDPVAAGSHSSIAPEAITNRLHKEQRLHFKHYRLLGSDSKPLYRSYENWAEPLKPSDQVMVRFEAQSEPTHECAILDLELWLGRKKTIKTDAKLEGSKPLFVLGPEWRGGRLIIAISFTQEATTER